MSLLLITGFANGAVGSANRLALANAIIMADGNSLTAGYLSSNSATKAWPAQMGGLEPFATNGAIIYNKGVSGQNTQQMSDDATTDIDTFINHSKTNILVYWEVTNDIYFNGDVAASLSRAHAYYAARKAAGWDKVYTLTCLPRSAQTPAYGGSQADFSAKVDATVAPMIANPDLYCDGLIDVRSNPNLATYNTTYFNEDHVHLTDAGYLEIATMVCDFLIAQ